MIIFVFVAMICLRLLELGLTRAEKKKMIEKTKKRVNHERGNDDARKAREYIWASDEGSWKGDEGRGKRMKEE